MILKNGHYLAQDQNTLEIQDGATGRFASLFIRKSPDGEQYVSGNALPMAPIIANLPILSAVFDAAIPTDKVPLADIMALFEADTLHRGLPVFPVPTLEVIRSVAESIGRPTSSKPDDVTAVAITATALAWRGGNATQFELDCDLMGLLADRALVDSALWSALTRSGKNITRLGTGLMSRWSMPATWTVPEWMVQARLPYRRA